MEPSTHMVGMRNMVETTGQFSGCMLGFRGGILIYQPVGLGSMFNLQEIYSCQSYPGG